MSSSTVPSASNEVIDRFLANVDICQVIFEMLPVKDRIRLEMTNKRLRILVCAYWKQVTLFDTECLTEMSCNPSISKNPLAAFVPICVNRIGDGLRSLTIREMSSPIAYHGAIVRSIGEGCANVETINFVFDYKCRTFDIHFDSFSHLKTLTFSNYSVYASDSIFLSIPASIEVIRGLEGCFDNAAQMEGFFADRPSMREVNLGSLYTHDGSKADIFRVIAERCPHLKSVKLNYYANHFIAYSGVIALESMKALLIPDAVLDEMEIVTICERSPLVEALSFKLRFSFYIDRQSAALNALGSLTKLRELRFYVNSSDVVASSLVTEFVRELARNSGASLRYLRLDDAMTLPTAAIEALANGCRNLRYVQFSVRVGEATPASIRSLVDSIVTHPSWIPQTGEGMLLIKIWVFDNVGHVTEAGHAPFKTLGAPAANLPPGVKLDIW